MQADQHDTDDEAAENYPDELGLAGTDATYDPRDAPAEDVVIRGNEYLPRGAWRVWIETEDGVIETTGEHVVVENGD